MKRSSAVEKPRMNVDIQIELWPIDRLVPKLNNPRTHSREQVANIAASIREFGWTNPILVGADDEIIAGHARLLAAKKLDMPEVPVIVLAHLSAAQRRALVIADNQLAVAGAGWDEEKLRIGAKFDRKKELAIAALLSHRSVEEAARAVGIGINTLYRWMKDPEFDAEYRQAKRSAFGQAIARLQQGTSAAATHSLMSGPIKKKPTVAAAAYGWRVVER